MGTRYFRIVMEIFFTCSMLMGCFEKKKEPNIYETFYTSGALKSKKLFWKEGVFVDTAYYYYENGNPSLIEVRNDSGVVNGEVRFFYQNGKIEQYFNCINGLKEGFLYRYSEEGYLLTKNFYLNDKMAGDVFGYDKAGHINYYGLHDFEGRNRNIITYDSITNKPIKNLSPDIFIVSTAFANETNKDSLTIKLLISNPAQRGSTVKINYLSKNGVVIKSDRIVGVPYSFIKEKIPSSLYVIKFVATQYDSLTRSTYEQVSTRKFTDH